ncbi:Transcriptional regulator, TetR family (plasmid) [Erwinia billingiae Eb661]|uniref:Transcriptional regulator, TetR family n=1 Tax=Erwinia billingiae (strain Eb661) TaxID=634500 RepID=D8MJC2_ERWBE|nr:TetR/AcrR family transcriptional regulator [Erwinia billingiae]CAX53306.1 Transcriptional regulator, TetR family [Erwinia billingiae Eb661]
MARPREFDIEEVSLKAMHVFWHKGFEATSLTDLLEATGLSKSSLYDTFSSKRGLFLVAFELFRQERMKALKIHLNSKSNAYDSIESFFRLVLAHANQEEPIGCMSCNEAIELGPHDEEVQQLIAKDFQGIEDALVEAIERGKVDGSIPEFKDSRMHGRALTVTYQGLQVMARSRSVKERLNDALTVVLEALHK